MISALDLTIELPQRGTEWFAQSYLGYNRASCVQAEHTVHCYRVLDALRNEKVIALLSWGNADYLQATCERKGR